MVLPIIAGAGLAAMYGYGAYSKHKAKKKRQREYRDIKESGGLANYDPTVGHARDSLGDQKEGAGGYLSALLSDYMGRQQDLPGSIALARPFIAGSVGNTQAFKDVQNYQQYADQLPTQKEMMQSYGTQAGRMAQTSGRAAAQAKGNMGRMGLGNSASMAAMAGQQAQGLSGNQSDLFAKMYQASLSQRMTNAQLQSNWAGRAYDAQRDLASMVMGSAQTPREPAQKTQMWGQIAQLAGTAIGGYLGGPAGAAAGGAAGGAMGNKGTETTVIEPGE